jgi:hypothetical protein
MLTDVSSPRWEGSRVAVFLIFMTDRTVPSMRQESFVSIFVTDEVSASTTVEFGGFVPWRIPSLRFFANAVSGAYYA